MSDLRAQALFTHLIHEDCLSAGEAIEIILAIARKEQQK